ncbi:MAG TPA: hypothetical protein H9815_19195 [Candidatus Ruania gallistercoris]|uniref:Uncharacterized protein n=1 Tax=Candidatus Ruania gallistercoris TaxID=2838746 RepID=A0A9D2EHU6_9MICO|nr:hypothetical protein [Candidatus Ruania gallistercoris]
MAYSPLPVKTSTRGPKILTAVGVVLLLAAIAVVVLVVRLFLSVLPTGIVAADGAPGQEAAGGTEVPGTVTLSLPADTTYAIYLAHPSSADDVELSDRITVTGPDGQAAIPAPTPSGTLTRSGVSAHDVSSFRTGAAGDYTVTAPELQDPDSTAWATIIVAESDNIPGFIGSVFGTIAGVFLAIGLGLAGLIVTIIGAIWWYTRGQNRRRVEAGGPNPPPPGQYPGAPGPPSGHYPGPPHRA